MIDVSVLDDYLQQRTADGEFVGVVRIDRDRSAGTTEVVMERGFGFASRAWQPIKQVDRMLGMTRAGLD